MKNLLSSLLIFFIALTVNAQCDCASADVTLPAAYPGGNYIFQANKVYCVNADLNMGWSAVTFQDNVTICIQPGVTLTMNGSYGSTSVNNHVTWNIGENAALINQNFGNVNFQLDLNIANGGKIQAEGWASMNFLNEFNLVIDSGGTFTPGNAVLNTSADINITNNGTFTLGQFLGSDTLNANINFVNNGTVNLTNSGSVQLKKAHMQLTNTGDVICGGVFDWGSSNNVNYLYNTGNLYVPNDLTSEDSKLSFYNYEGANFTITGNFNYGTEGPNVFENYGSFQANGLYANDPTLQLKNEGDITINIYSDTGSSVMSNCGEMEITGFFGLLGKIINTGNYISGGTIDFNSQYASLENYSMMTLTGINMTGSNSLIYNEGEIDFTSTPNSYLRFAGPGATQQPEHSESTSYGLFTWPGSQSNQSGYVAGNLNFVTTTPGSVDDSSPNNSTSMFGQWNTITFDDTVVFGECSSCTIVTEYDQCANADGTWPEIEPIINCIPVNRHIRSFLKS